MDWLKNLKAGDTVLVEGRNNLSSGTAKVKKITPTGRIVIENGITYGQNGYPLGEPYPTTHITQPTLERVTAIRQARLADKLSQTDYSKLELLKLKAIECIVNGDVPTAAQLLNNLDRVKVVIE